MKAIADFFGCLGTILLIFGGCSIVTTIYVFRSGLEENFQQWAMTPNFFTYALLVIGSLVLGIMLKIPAILLGNREKRVSVKAEREKMEKEEEIIQKWLNQKPK